MLDRPYQKRQLHLPTAEQVAACIRQPVQLPAAPTLRPSAEGSLWLWSLCFVSFVGLQAIQVVGTLGALAFVAPWVLIIGTRMPTLATGLRKDWPMLVLPLAATASTLWSPVPDITMRAGLEFFLSVVIAIAAARCISPATTLTSAMAGLAVLTIAGLARAGHREIGLYGSHNQMAGFSAMALIIAGVFLVFERTSLISKLAYAGTAAVGVAGVYAAHSAGTLFALFGSVGLVGALRLRLLQSLSAKLLCGVAALLVAFVIVHIGPDAVYARILRGVGKSGSLSGRTDLWQEGMHQIASSPLLGHGFAAFWVPGNPPAERLWAMFGITDKVGFHFHNSFINVSVDLGLLGAVPLVLLLAGVARAYLKTDWSGRGRSSVATACLFFFLLVLCFVEAEFTFMFSISSIVLCLAWADGIGVTRMSGTYREMAERQAISPSKQALHLG